MNIAELTDILTLEIPSPPKKEATFLDIVGQPFRENTISRVYAYFLDHGSNSVLAGLFLDALADLIREKGNKEIELTTFACDTEVMTPKGGRIDLLIHSKEDKKCIIIENKIFHVVNNDLDDYWKVHDYEECNKAGVLLTLSPHEIPADGHNRYVNITHREWVNKVRSKGIPAGISIKELIYLNDFIIHMENTTGNSEIGEAAKFYFAHAAKVNKAIQTYDAAFEYVIAQLKQVAAGMNWTLYGNSHDWRHIWDAKNGAHVYYAIEIYALFDAVPKINIIVEVYKDAIGKQGMFRQLLAGDPYYAALSTDNNRSGTGWSHFANKWYDLKISDLNNFAAFIQDTLNRDFKPVMDKLLIAAH